MGEFRRNSSPSAPTISQAKKTWSILLIKVRSYLSFLLVASLLSADLLVGGDMTGKVDLKWDTVIIVFGRFFLL